MNILGISAYYHDSAAVLVRDGEIVAAAQEERFTRKKHDASFPTQAVRYCLAEGGVRPDGLNAVAFYEKPICKFARLLETYLSVAPRGLRSFQMAMPIWMREKLWIPMRVEAALQACGVACQPALFFPEHHESHAASAFYPSPFPRAAILTVDGVGEWATSTVGHGVDNRVNIVQELRFPHSLGLLYSAFTYFAGFKVNSGEYKLMGLAPFGEPKYARVILEQLVDLRPDGSLRLNMEYFGYLDGLTMTNSKFARLFGGPPRLSEAEITQREMDLAASIQFVTEEAMLRMARHAYELTGEKYLCMAGGVALNCVANGRILREGPFADIWIQPAAGDAGGALGAALAVWHQSQNQPRVADGKQDRMRGALLGPAFADDEIEAFLKARGYPYRRLTEPDWAPTLAGWIAEGKVVGLVNGRMEFGPRALGSRSIIGDARSPAMQSLLNLKIKFRESFRPFAPSCLLERVGDYFELDRASPYMLMVAPVRESRRRALDPAQRPVFREWVHQARSNIPAVTHVDYSARIQTVSADVSPRYHELLKAFERLTGCGVIINTSFNVRGEPLVCTPEDAYRCFMRTGMDFLALGSCVLAKFAQPPWTEGIGWRRDYVLD